MGICAHTILQKSAKNDDFFGENFEKITKKSRKITKKMTKKSRFFTDVSAQNHMILTFWWKKYFFRGKNLSENLHKISGFTLFANSGGFRGGQNPPGEAQTGGKSGGFSGVFGGSGEIRRGRNLADFVKFGWFLTDFWPNFPLFYPHKARQNSLRDPPKSPGFPEVHPPGPPGDPPGRKNSPFSGGKTSESTVEDPKFRGVFSGGHPGAPGGEFREISGNSGKFRSNCPQNPPHLLLFFPILNLRKHGRTAEMPGELSGGFQGAQLTPILRR